jgi:hypothetical protein
MQILDTTAIQPMGHSDPPPRALPLWPLPLMAGLLPAIAVLLALALFAGEGKVPASCNPFIDDCVSISRMAKHGLANQLFRVFVLPAAVLQMLTWLAAARALFAAGLARREAFLLALLGVFAGVALVLYGSFLGSDGQVYRWLRRWGAVAYFGGAYLAMLVFARASQRLHKANRLALPHSHGRVMLALLAFIAAISVFHLSVSAAGFANLEDRIENLTEWWGSVAMTLYFMTVASLWRRWGMATTISLQRPGAEDGTGNQPGRHP